MAIPTKDPLLVPYSTNFSTRVTNDYPVFKLTQEQAQTYAQLHAAYLSAYQAVADARMAGTRSESLTATKDAAKGRLLSLGRQLYTYVQASNDVSDADKILLGVTVKDNQPSPTPTPTARPDLDVTTSYGRTVVVAVHDNTNSSRKRAKAPGATAAWVYCFVGADYPTDPAGWTFCGATSNGRFDVVLPDSVPNGSQVWICALWVNRKQEGGPVSLPVTTNIAGGGTVRMAA